MKEAKQQTLDLPTDTTPVKPEDSDEGSGASFGAYLRIFRYATTTEYALEFGALLGALGSGAAIAVVNLVFGEFITVINNFRTGQTTADEFRSEAARLALYFVYIGIARFVLVYTYVTLSTLAAYRITRNIRHAYLKAALRQEVAFFDFGSGGSIAMQATSNGRLIQGGIAEKLGLTFQGISGFVTAFAIAFATQWKLTLIVLCIAPTIIILLAVVASIEAGHETKMLSILADGGNFAEGVLASARTVHAFEMRPRMVEKFKAFLGRSHAAGKKLSPLMGVLFSVEYFVIYAGFGLAFWQGVNMLGRGEIDNPGVIFTVLLSVVIGTTALSQIAPYVIEFTRAASAAAKLFDLIDRVSKIDAFDKTGEQPTDTAGVIDVENVTFSYPTRPGVTVLNDFSLHVPAGKVTALVGASGSGKSTIVGLIERWYNPSSGSIKLDGMPIEKLNLNWLRTNVRLVQQEPILFQGTIFDNIANGLVGTPWENASQEIQMQRIEEAAKVAFAHEFVSSLPQGYYTKIGQRGSLLSGGQKQRIAIARSIVSQPKVLLLDEATSALDPHAEGVVQQALDNASKDRTTIVIAHKLATIKKADNIVVMGKGHILEQGTHESLLAQDGAYARLVKVQNLSVSEDVQAKLEVDSDDTELEHDEVDLTKSVTRYGTALEEALEVQKERDNYDTHKQKGFISLLVRLTRESSHLWWAYALVILSCLGGAASFPLQTFIIANLTDIFALPVDEMVSRGNFFALMFFVLALGCFCTYFILGWSTNVVAQAMNHKYREQMFHDFLRQDLQFFDRPENTTGALASKMDSYPQSILELMGYNIALILIAMVSVIACSILALAVSWKFSVVVVLAGMPPLVASGYIRIRLDSKLDNDTSKRYSTSASIASEAITAIRTVSSLAIEETVLKRYTEELDHAINLSVGPLFLMMIWFALTQSIEYWVLALGFWYGCRLFSLGEITMYAFFMAFMGIFFSGQAASQMFSFSTSLTKARNAADYIFWLHGLQPAVQETEENRQVQPDEYKSVNFADTQFSYPLRPDARVLRGVSLNVQKGQFVALVGASGCGKSTMIGLLERFYDPTKGSISIDGEPLRNLNPRLYRQGVALVQQEPTLFDGTIRENVALGIDLTTSTGPPTEAPSSTTVSDEEIEKALRAANAWTFVSSLPEGLNTPCGANGTQLSGGQRQRIAIARALVRNPRLLLLDEATSALDTESEKVVQAALAQAASEGDRITVAVAHRLSTIKDADVICVFYAGRIVEMGTHPELVAMGGMYAKMCEAQNLE